jgi:hypothetical protein
MKIPSLAPSFYDWPLPELRLRSDRACTILRRARSVVGRPGALQCVDLALDELERLLPGLTDRAPTLVDRAVRQLEPRARAALREAIDAEQTARDRLDCMLGDVPVAVVDAALTRLEQQDAILRELMHLLTHFERVYGLARSSDAARDDLPPC